jgi:hypothetical protein
MLGTSTFTLVFSWCIDFLLALQIYLWGEHIRAGFITYLGEDLVTLAEYLTLLRSVALFVRLDRAPSAANGDPTLDPGRPPSAFHEKDGLFIPRWSPAAKIRPRGTGVSNIFGEMTSSGEVYMALIPEILNGSKGELSAIGITWLGRQALLVEEPLRIVSLLIDAFSSPWHGNSLL